jgi:hypothetical protein
MQRVSKIAVINLGAFRVAFRVLVKGGKDTDFSDIFLARKHEVIDLRDRCLTKGTEVRPEIDVTPIREKARRRVRRCSTIRRAELPRSSRGVRSPSATSS